jgi:16S rRNA (cytidine1402-2'-O)-methyltransferase
VARETFPVVLFEAPHRIAETLKDLAAASPEREAVVCRELSKLHEEALRGTLRELAALEREWLGEIVVVLGEAPARPPAGSSDEEILARARALVESGASVRAVADHLSEITGRARREVYALALAAKGDAEP